LLGERLCQIEQVALGAGEHLLEEPEGLTWWDLTAPNAPSVPGTTSSGLRVADTQLHAILLDNDFLGDDVYVKPYRVSEPDRGLPVASADVLRFVVSRPRVLCGTLHLGLRVEEVQSSSAR